MRVVFINLVYGNGSTGKIIADIMTLLHNSGNQALALYGVEWGASKDNSIACSTKIEYYFHNYVSRVTDHAGLYSILSTKRIIKEIKAFQPDLIHLHTLHGFYVNYEMLFRFLKKANIPVVWTLHDCWSFTGHCTHFSQAKCTQWKTQCKNCALLFRYPQCRFKGDVTKNHDRKKAAFTGVKNLTLTVPSKWLADQVMQSFLKEYPLYIIPNGVDFSVFHPRASELRYQHGLKGKIIVLGVANAWNERKGMRDIIELAQRLDSKYQVVMIGLTEKQLSSLPPKILGIKRTTNQEELAQWYATADVFVNPTYEETFGMTTIEAQACGTPVAVYRTDGCPETVMPDNGILVEQGNIAKLESAIYMITQNKMRSNPETLLKFEKSCVYSNYIALYEQILNAHTFPQQNC